MTDLDVMLLCPGAFSTRASVDPVLRMHPCLSSCLWVNPCGVEVVLENIRKIFLYFISFHGTEALRAVEIHPRGSQEEPAVLFLVNTMAVDDQAQLRASQSLGCTLFISTISPSALYHYCGMTPWQGFRPMRAQLSLKASLPPAEGLRQCQIAAVIQDLVLLIYQPPLCRIIFT